MTVKILIIEDEQELASDMVRYLTGEQYVCETADTYQQATDKIAAYDYDCILLDLMLPGGDGMRLLEMLKRMSRSDGVIIISAKNAIEDKVKGLQTGADDYLTKPFHHAELLARVHSLIRRKQFDSSNTISQNEINVNLLAKTVKVNEHNVNLTKKELELLLFFMGNRNKVISKNALAEHLSGDIADMFDNHDFIYAHVKNLKRKLSEAGYGNYLKTFYGAGYKWEI